MTRLQQLLWQPYGLGTQPAPLTRADGSNKVSMLVPKPFRCMIGSSSMALSCSLSFLQAQMAALQVKTLAQVLPAASPEQLHGLVVLLPMWMIMPGFMTFCSMS